MRKRNSLIVIVVLIIILGVGLGVYKIFFAPRPLKIKDLENMHITTTRSSQEMGWTLTLLYDFVKWSEFGSVQDNSNYYEDTGNVSRWRRPVCIMVYEEKEPIALQAGDKLKITYDGGQSLTIYLPGQIMDEETHLYIATDGSTYYNKRLTQLAQAAPQP